MAARTGARGSNRTRQCGNPAAAHPQLSDRRPRNGAGSGRRRAGVCRGRYGRARSPAICGEKRNLPQSFRGVRRRSCGPHARRQVDRNADGRRQGAGVSFGDRSIRQEAGSRRPPRGGIVPDPSGVRVVHGSCGLSGRPGPLLRPDGHCGGLHPVRDFHPSRGAGLRQSVVLDANLCCQACASLSRCNQSAAAPARGSEHLGSRGRGRRRVDPQLYAPRCRRTAPPHQSDGKPDGRLHIPARQPRPQGRERVCQFDRHVDRKDIACRLERPEGRRPGAKTTDGRHAARVCPRNRPSAGRRGGHAHPARRNAVAAPMDGHLRCGVWTGPRAIHVARHAH